jgi:hypothetical protein
VDEWASNYISSDPPKWKMIYSKPGDITQTDEYNCGVFADMGLYLFMRNGVWATGADLSSLDMRGARKFMIHFICRWREYQSTEAIEKSTAIDSVTAHIRECQRNDTAQPEIYVLNDDSDVD